MIIINITEFKRNIREFQDEKLPKTEDLETHEKEFRLFYLRTSSVYLNGVNKKLNFGE